MTDLTQTREHVKKAEEELVKALEALTPITSIRQVDAYVVGHIKGAVAVLREALGAIDQTTAFKKAVSKRKKEEP